MLLNEEKKKKDNFIKRAARKSLAKSLNKYTDEAVKNNIKVFQDGIANNEKSKSVWKMKNLKNVISNEVYSVKTGLEQAREHIDPSKVNLLKSYMNNLNQLNSRADKFISSNEKKSESFSDFNDLF